jgi:hypothetical protein
MLLLLIAACGGGAPAPEPTLPVSEPFVEAKPVEAEPVPGAPVNADDAKRAATEFLEQVRDSSGAITGCWNSAQSANPALRAKEIPLSITAEFDPSGMVKLSLSPMVTEAFAECVNQRAAGWKVAVTQKMTFKASINLKP